MAARSEIFPWPSHYGHFDFFEARMKSHDCVASCERLDGGLYDVTTRGGKVLRIFICECYSFGVAEYMEAVGKLGALDAVIINSFWCGYTTDAKRYCRGEKIGLFDIGDFMAALHHNDFSAYLNDRDTEVFEKNGWI